MSKIMITGATGAVGTKLSSYLRTIGHQIIPVALMPHNGVIAADLRNEATILRLVKDYTPDLILHLAAITDLNFCEQHQTETHITNYGITEILTKVCLKFRIRMLFFSSDYVFGKYDHYWQEDDLPCPTTQYGSDKAASEKIIQERLTNYAIVRTAQLYGFTKDFVSLVYNTLRSKQEFRAFANLVNCPTWIGDLFPMVNTIITNNLEGIFHCVGPEALSRYQYACVIATGFNLDISYIKPINLDFAIDIRPHIVRLNGTSTYKILQISPNKLQDNLHFCFPYIN
ncbi:hypothetical protein TI05_02440 [Achromatium sp. WMS3]|nr:hypothetical protein TI05_02440 [Achromatium sp. WMS3]